jgi:hypothetical protein
LELIGVSVSLIGEGSGSFSVYFFSVIAAEGFSCFGSEGGVSLFSEVIL